MTRTPGGKANRRANMKEPREKPHNHFPQGKTGMIPRGVGYVDLRILKR